MLDELSLSFAIEKVIGLALRFGVLLRAAEDGQDSSWRKVRWRLVQLLYDQYRAMLEGSLALLLLIGLCGWLTHDPVFLTFLAAVLVVTAARCWLTRQFQNRAGSGGTASEGTPERWAWRFALGNAGTAALFGALGLYVCLVHDRPTLQMLVILVQGAWIAGSTQRNAPSPFTVFAQVALISVPTIVGAAMSTSPVVHWVILFIVGHAFSARGTARFFGTMYLNVLLTEQRLATANTQLTQISSTDGLTGIANRRTFDAELPRKVARALRTRQPLALLMIDVDHFKAYNDKYGHLGGDDCLRRIAEAIQGCLRRPPDIITRFGGEEFAALLPDTPREGALNVAEAVRDAVASLAIAHEGSPFGRVTISIGVTSDVPIRDECGNALLAQADAALYRAKAAGRNHVCTADRPDLPAEFDAPRPTR